MKDGEVTPDDKKIEVIVNRCLQELMEQGCASARIFVTYQSAGASNHTALSKGQGNQWTQKGQIRDWVITETEKVKADIWKDKVDSEDDEGDDDDEDPSKTA